MSFAFSSGWRSVGSRALLGLLTLMVWSTDVLAEDDELTEQQLQVVKRWEARRIAAVEKVVGSVIAIYDEDRQGGGSGVVITPDGIALTNHHVIIGAGVQGWGGMADGKLYRWKLIGTDPGGDVAIIQMEGRDDFPFSPLGDSDKVRVGDWALAMGNPFILTEDQAPTVTLGIVSGVKRYQPGAGQNQLVYGNCIQVDSSINPGNSGGPLFNFNGEVIGINGRGSFDVRLRVNVGLGYAISANQIRNFIPDLLATKLVEHATLDANFEDRGGKVVCAKRNVDAPVSQAGLELGDELLEFEGVPIRNANQFTNLICTLPEDWPIQMKIRKPDGEEKWIHARAIGLPYRKPGKPRFKDEKDRTPQEQKQIERQMEMINLLAAKPGTTRMRQKNRKYAMQIWDDWRGQLERMGDVPADSMLYLQDDLVRDGQKIGQQQLWLTTGGRFQLTWSPDGETETYRFDGQTFFKQEGETWKQVTSIHAKLKLPLVQAMLLAASLDPAALDWWGEPLIDGSGKSDQQPTYRLIATDEEGDDFYFWTNTDPVTGKPDARLTKAAAHRDCRDGGVMLTDWQVQQGCWLPAQRRLISGLAETTVMEIRLNQAEWLPTDESLFTGTPASRSDESKEGP